jgi:chaperone BCS1
MQGVGVGITALRRGAVLASVALRRRLLVTLEINNKDRAYDWFLAWLAHQQRTTRRPAWAHSHQLSVETAYAQHKIGSADVLFKLVAGPGVHWLKYRGAWMQVRFFPPLLTPLDHTFFRPFLSLIFVSFFFFR